MNDKTPLGRFVWYECLAADLKAAEDFYTALIGWTTQPFEGGPMPYTMWVNDATPIGGLLPLPDEAKQQGAPPHWLAYVSTPDVDKTLADASAAGARVLAGPMDIPTVGRMVVLADPQGAVLAAFTPAGETPTQPPQDAIGAFTWHELLTSDPDAAFDFYSSLFGWVKTETMDMGDMGTYQMYGPTPELTVGGIMKKPDQMPVAAWNLYVNVDSTDTRAAQVKELGGQVMGDPMDIPGGGRIAQCLDPQGAMFAPLRPGQRLAYI